MIGWRLSDPGSTTTCTAQNCVRSSLMAAGLSMLAASLLCMPAQAERLTNKVAVFAALDKVTARIKRLEVPLDETVVFGALKVTARICYSRPPTEPPKTTSFVEISETELDGTEKPLFSGWMFAQSPGLNAVEHPVFDVWLTGCEKPEGGNVQSTAAAVDDTGVEQPVTPRRKPRRRRVRR